MTTLLKGRRFMLIFVSIMLVAILVLVGVLLVWSPGKPVPFVDKNGNPLPNSISEKIFVPINGLDQGMFIKGKNVNNPVLLFLHGGPGMPEYWLSQRYPTSLENDFTVVWWEQRGSGLSYHATIAPETMTAEQFIADTLEVTHYLRKRFGQKKIYLMGHSWGSYLGLQVVARSPEWYQAYIGVGQITYQLESEHLAYDYALEQYAMKGDVAMVRKLEAAPPTDTPPFPKAYESLRDGYMHGLGVGTFRDMKSVVTGIFLPSWRFREYTLGEKLNLWRGKIFSRSPDFNLWDKMQATDLTREVIKLDIPAYFIHGAFDYTCSYSLAKVFVDQLQAPLKGFYTFEKSAHSPLFEEPEKMQAILREDVLAGRNSLADAK